MATSAAMNAPSSQTILVVGGGIAGMTAADVIATPCPLCQTNVEMYQDQINKKFRTDDKIPVVFCSQLMAVAFGMDANKDAALNQNIIAPVKLIELAQAGQKKAVA